MSTAIAIYLYVTWVIGAIALLFGVVFVVKEMAEINKQGYADKDDRHHMRENWVAIIGGILAPLVIPALAGWGIWAFVKTLGKSLGVAFGRNKVV